MTAPTVKADVALPSMQGDLKTTDFSNEIPSAHLEATVGQVDVQMPEVSCPRESCLKRLLELA